MKKGRILSMLLVLVMILSLAPVSVSAAAGEYYVSKETFNYADANDLTANGWAAGFQGYYLGDDIKGFEGSKSLCLSDPNNAGTKVSQATKTLTEVRTKEKYNISFDVRIDNTAVYASGDSWAGLTVRLFNDTLYKNFIKFNCANKISILGDENLGSFEWNKTYHIDIQGDLDHTKMTYVTITDENNSIIASKYANFVMYNSTTAVNTFDKLAFLVNLDGTSVATNNDTKTYIDNLKIEYPGNSSVATLGTTESFDTYTNPNAADWAYQTYFNKMNNGGWIFTASSYVYLVSDGYENTQGFKLGYNTSANSWGGVWSSYRIDGVLNSTTALTTGRVNTNFKVKIEPNTDGTLGVFRVGTGRANGHNRTMISFNANGKIGVGPDMTDTEHSYNVDTWYDVNIVYDVETRKVEYTIKEVANPTNIMTGTTTLSEHEYIETITNVNFVTIANIVNTGDEEGGAVVDNIALTYLAPAPELVEGSLKVYNMSGALQEDLSKISAATDKITFDLGSGLDIDTVNDDTIYLKNVTDNTYVQYRYSATGTVVTLELTKMLEANKDYQLVLTDDVKNTSGISATPFTIDMKTLPAELKAEYGDVKVGDALLSNITQITAGSKISIDVEMLNTTGNSQTPCVIFSYFAGNKLIGATVDKTSLALSSADMQKTETASSTIPTFAAGETVDTVKIFIWSGMDTLKAMGDFYSFPAAE